MRIKYYEDTKENATFERCTDVITNMIIKYGPLLKRKWAVEEWLRNIHVGCFWKELAVKRYGRYAENMKKWWPGKKCCMTISDCLTHKSNL